MNHDGELGGCGQFHLAKEDFFLRVARRVIVIVVKPDLAPGNHFGMPRQPLHF